MDVADMSDESKLMPPEGTDATEPPDKV